MRILLAVLLLTGCSSVQESKVPRVRIQMGSPQDFGFPPANSIDASKAEILRQWGEPRSVFSQPRRMIFHPRSVFYDPSGRRDTEVWVYPTDDPKRQIHIYFAPGSKGKDNVHPLDSIPHIRPAISSE